MDLEYKMKPSQEGLNKTVSQRPMFLKIGFKYWL